MASRVDEDSFPFVPLAYLDEVIRAAVVQLGEDSGSAEMFEWRWDERKRITELGYNIVECLVIDTRQQVSVLLGHKEKSLKQQGTSKGGCYLVEEPLRYTPACMVGFC